MSRYYVAPTALLDTDPPPTGYHAHSAPGNATWSLVVVDEWRVASEQDRWEALPGVTELRDWAAKLPPQVATLLAGWGAATTDTLDDAFQKIRRRWPGRINR